MILGKHINRYYLRYAPMLLLGLIALMGVDYLQLEIPALYRMVLQGMENGFVKIDEVVYNFDMNFVLDYICMPMVRVIVLIIIGLIIFFTRVKLTEEKHAQIVAELEKTWDKDALSANGAASDAPAAAGDAGAVAGDASTR